MDIKELEQRVKTLRDELTEANRALTEAKLAACGVAIGDVVISGRDMKEYRVCAIDTCFRGKPWLEGNPRKKDGTWSIARRRLTHHWVKP